MKQRHIRWYYLTAVLLIVIASIATITYLGPSLPSVVVMTTGAPGGDFDEFGQRYKEIFERAGVELLLLPSAGSLENLRRLNDPNSGVSVGFIQGGLTSEKLSPELVSLGALCYEPIWCFYRGVDPGPRLDGLRGRKVSIGPEGSGSRDVITKLLTIDGIHPEMMDLLAMPAAESGEHLLRGEISAAIMVVSWDAPIVRKLLADPDIEIMNFNRADALVALCPFLNKLVLPAGVGNMALNRPPVDINMLAPKASLVVRRDLNTSFKYLLLEAASQIHSGPGVFQKSGQFPAAERIDLPLSTEAQQYYKSGPPFLQRYLPFQLAELAGRLLVLLIPLIGIAYPLLRLMPGLYGVGMRQRIFKLYGEVKSIEIEMEKDPSKNPAELLARLDRLESRAIHMWMPANFAHLIYRLRRDIALVRLRLQQRGRQDI